MKKLVQLSVLSLIFLSLFGCASSGDKFETRLPPPDAMNPVFAKYKDLPGEKVFVIAVDPGGYWAFGYDHSKNSLEEAARSAAKKCDEARKKYNVINKAKLFAVNNEVVYFNEK
ncbi:MAG: hypothetical protein AB7E95_07635 [Kiritimatiellales bacterium]|jgi:hypothetical protein